MFVPRVWIRRNNLGHVEDCNFTSSVDHCMCCTYHSHYCPYIDECLDKNYCAKSARPGNHFCVGCTTLTSLGTNKRLITLNSSDARVRFYDEGRQHPSCGHAKDLCSVTIPCDPKYECADRLPDDRLFRCSSESTRWQCVKHEGNVAHLKTCTNDDDCEVEGICAYYTTEGWTFCLSCHFLKNLHKIKTSDSRSGNADGWNFPRYLGMP